ncbi:DUF5641 domain-containing protein [Trichonephila clavipes]|nr:DUF5641 domain-containing protein [Trichonephila clavipes]
MNPADIACRGLSPKELPTCVLWYRATTSKQLMGDLPTHRSLDCDNDPDSLNILTPSHFLIGEVITSSPEHTNDDKLSLRYCWDIVQKMKLGFWRKWKIDYLSNLQNRTKWKSPNHNIKVGEIVIIKEDNIPPATWPLGKVIETHPGKDGVVRVVTLRTVKGRFKRPIHKLCKLPLHQE